MVEHVDGELGVVAGGLGVRTPPASIRSGKGSKGKRAGLSNMFHASGSGHSSPLNSVPPSPSVGLFNAPGVVEGNIVDPAVVRSAPKLFVRIEGDLGQLDVALNGVRSVCLWSMVT